MFKQNEYVKVDKAHAEVIKGLVYGQKPKTILEMGLGGGESTDAILEALKYNGQPYNYILVDNWEDHNYTMPEGVMELYSTKVNIVTSSEASFVMSTKERFDFIMSDADHTHAQLWFDYVYDTLLNPDGILIYHDINLFEDTFENLRVILYRCNQRRIKYKLFNKNTVIGERCHRGLLVIFK